MGVCAGADKKAKRDAESGKRRRLSSFMTFAKRGPVSSSTGELRLTFPQMRVLQHGGKVFGSLPASFWRSSSAGTLLLGFIR